MCKQEWEEVREGAMGVLGKGHHGRGNSECKCPEALACVRNRKKTPPLPPVAQRERSEWEREE